MCGWGDAAGQLGRGAGISLPLPMNTSARARSWPWGDSGARLPSVSLLCSRSDWSALIAESEPPGQDRSSQGLPRQRDTLITSDVDSMTLPPWLSVPRPAPPGPLTLPPVRPSVSLQTLYRRADHTAPIRCVPFLRAHSPGHSPESPRLISGPDRAS